jgi:hypothetical protein
MSSGPVALAGVLIFLIFGALVLPRQAAAAERVAGDAGSPDTSLLYTSADLVRQAEAYGEEGREAYVRARWTFDLIFPLVYGFFLLTSISWLLGWSLAADSPWHRINLVPMVAVAFDFLENTATSWVMSRYPAGTPVAAFVAPWFTLSKWLFVYGSFGVLAVAAWSRSCRRSARSSTAAEHGSTTDCCRPWLPACTDPCGRSRVKTRRCPKPSVIAIPCGGID